MIFLLNLYRYLYTLDFPESRVISQPDQTLEILMSELDPAVMDQFYMKDGVTAKDVTRVSIFSNSGSVWGLNYRGCQQNVYTL